jgi:UPF0176 protein
LLRIDFQVDCAAHWLPQKSAVSSDTNCTRITLWAAREHMKDQHSGVRTDTPALNKAAEPQTVVCALYKFTHLADYQLLREPILKMLNKHALKGTLLLAQEGINGTIAGEQTALQQFLHWLQADERFSGIDYKLSHHDRAPFYRTKVKLKKEIVTMGVADIDPNKIVGTYVEPRDWNALIADPETLLIDTRNNYEVEIGTFNGALNPETETFREFPEYVAQHFDPQQHKKVAMFCTGGIRCEKASAFMKEHGFDEVYHLKGGILKYLEQVEPKESQWRGECFVFDDRVAVDHSLSKGQYDQCHACRYPITEQDKHSPNYVAGVSCPRCYDRLTDEQKSRFAERERQMTLARERGEQHIGTDSRAVAKANKEKKIALKRHQDSERNN